MKSTYLTIGIFISILSSSQPTFSTQEIKYFGDIITPDIGIHRIIPSLKSSVGSSNIYIVQARVNGIYLSNEVSKAPNVFRDTSVIALINIPKTGYQKINGQSNGYKLGSSTAYFGWIPIENNFPYLRFFEREDFNSLSKRYLNVIEGTLLIKQDSVMIKDEYDYMSISAIGLDKYNNLIFVHSRSPYSLNKFALMLLESLKGIKALILTATGQESVLGFKGVDEPEFSYGSYLSGKTEHDNNTNFFLTPLLVVRQKHPSSR